MIGGSRLHETTASFHTALSACSTPLRDDLNSGLWYETPHQTYCPDLPCQRIHTSHGW